MLIGEDEADSNLKTQGEEEGNKVVACAKSPASSMRFRPCYNGLVLITSRQQV